MRLNCFWIILLSSLALVGCSSEYVDQDKYVAKYNQSIELIQIKGLDITVENGSIDIIGSDNEELTRAEMTVAIEALGEGYEEVRSYAESLRVDVETNGENLVLREDNSARPAYIDSINTKIYITVPKSKIKCVKAKETNGSMYFRELEATLQLSSINGAVLIEQVQLPGSSTIKTTNGIIQADVTLPLAGDFLFSTTNGVIALIIPPTTKADLQVETVNGRLSNNLPITNTSSGSGRTLVGSMNGGGAQIIVETTNGDVELTSVTGK
jgi:DUF4097 and DUF4098 domain-containing protein YvlB